MSLFLPPMKFSQLTAGFSGKRKEEDPIPIAMYDPLEIPPRYRKAVYRCVWFGAGCALVCVVLAALSWTGTMGKAEDAPMLIGMALGGATLSVFGRLIIRFLRI
jgi:hypothetical protein